MLELNEENVEMVLDEVRPYLMAGKLLPILSTRFCGEAFLSERGTEAFMSKINTCHIQFHWTRQTYLFSIVIWR